jgi:hypothetical protein
MHVARYKLNPIITPSVLRTVTAELLIAPFIKDRLGSFLHQTNCSAENRIETLSFLTGESHEIVYPYFLSLKGQSQEVFDLVFFD